jgi:hypothetical protein
MSRYIAMKFTFKLMTLSIICMGGHYAPEELDWEGGSPVGEHFQGVMPAQQCFS